MSVSTLEVKNTLAALIEVTQQVATGVLKENGFTSDNCQLVGLINTLDQAEQLINGIEQSDIRLPESGYDNRPNEDVEWPKEQIVFQGECLIDAYSSLEATVLPSLSSILDNVDG